MFTPKTVLAWFALTSSVFSIVQCAEEEHHRVAQEIHNGYRAAHHVEPLDINDDLNERAAKCAQYYADIGKIDHSCPYKNGSGENLWAQWRGNPSDVVAVTKSNNGWYSEESRYNYTLDHQPGTGHFTQMVWKTTRELGIGTARRDEDTYVCALYYPHGNLIGAFHDNVFKP